MSKQRQKYLDKLSKKEKEKIFLIIKKLMEMNFDGLDIKSITGESNLWRCRVGDLRILFTKEGKKVTIKKLLPRGDIY